MSHGLISVVIPTYNRGDKLVSAIRSVLVQTHANLDVIVVDDGSTDRVLERLEDLADNRLRTLCHPTNRGAAAARNTGVRAARGEWIAFQDSDDVWLPSKLATQAALLSQLGPDYVAVFCAKIDYGRNEKRQYGRRRVTCMPDPREKIESGDLHPRLLRGNIIGPQTAVIKRAALEAAGGFDERLRNNEDWDFFIRLSHRGKIAFLDEPLVVVMSSPDSISRNRRYSAASFVRIYGKIRKKSDDRRLMAQHASTVGSNLRRIGRRRSAGLYLRKAIRLDPLVPKTYLKFLYNLLG